LTTTKDFQAINNLNSMKRFFRLRLFCVLLTVLSLTFSSSSSAQTSPPTPFDLSGIFNNKGELGIDSVKSAALAQSTATPYYKSNGVETRYYEGYFKPATSSSKLALLSDDGTSVWIDGQQVLNRAGQGQGFENFDSTFYPLSKTFVAGQIYHLRLQYTNTVHRNDADVDGVSLWAYDGGGGIVTLNLSVATAKTEICAGGLADTVHQTEITATVKDGNNVVVPNISVSFIVENSHLDYPATLSTASVSTSPQGQAKTTLTSSRKISATAKVKARVASIEAVTPSITAQDAQEDWSISPEELEADDQSQATVKLTLKHQNQAVANHQITWRINKIWDADGAQIYDATTQVGSTNGYGSLSSTSSTSNSNGVVTTNYNAGSEGGVIEFAALDYTMVANSPRVRTSTKKLDVGVFYVYTYVGNNPSASSAGNYVGPRAAPHWVVTLNAIIRRPNAQGPPPQTINFVRKRYVNGQAGNPETGTVVGNLRSSTPGINLEYWSYAPETPPANWNQAGGWDITKLKGRWQISVKYTNNTTPRQFPAYFKIDKRSQIVTTARNWFDATAVELSNASGTGDYCADFTAMIYRQLGLGSLSAATGEQYGQMTRNDNGDGAILFYRGKTSAAAPFNAAHAAIRDGNARININSNTLAHQPRNENQTRNNSPRRWIHLIRPYSRGLLL
jgi:hypothetical protein